MLTKEEALKKIPKKYAAAAEAANGAGIDWNVLVALFAQVVPELLKWFKRPALSAGAKPGPDALVKKAAALLAEAAYLSASETSTGG
jgi:hypothetical protein